MPRDFDVTCPHCGEPGTVSVDEGSEHEEFVQDCGICCRPWRVRVRLRRDGSAEVTVSGESE